MRRREFLLGMSSFGVATLAGRDRCCLNAGRIRQPDMCDIGSRVEMFLDRFLIEREDNVSLRLHPPERREIALTLDQRWEGPSSAYYTVFRDGDIVRLYYRASGSYQGGQQAPVCFCYAESRDGLHFQRPNLGLFEFEASRANNIIFRDPIAQDSFAPMRDANPDAHPGQRYKALVSTGGGLLYAAESPDGLRWKWMQPEPVSHDGSFDSLNVAFWDPGQQQYRMFSRYLDVPGLTTNAERNRAVWNEGTAQNWVRAIQSSTSKDFVHWQPAVPHGYSAGSPREHFYTNATIPCPGAEHILLSFPKRFLEERRVMPTEKHEFSGVSDTMFLSSRDGQHWDRTFLEAWVRPGLDERNWTQRSNMITWGILETSPSEFSLYVSEHYEWPDNRLRRLAVRRHGFASVHAGARGGEMLTRPLRFSGDKLQLNYSTSAGGSIRVELQDADGNALPGRSLAECDLIYGDHIARAVTWQGEAGVSAVAEKPARLRFQIQDADLFALQFSRKV